MIINVYTDAAHCHINKIGACGYFIILEGGIVYKHSVVLVELPQSHDAEAYAICLALQEIYLLHNVSKVIVYSDHDTSVLIINKEVKRKVIRLNEMYKELSEHIECFEEIGIPVKAWKVKAHANNKINTKVDISVRKQLRVFLKSISTKE